MKRKSIRKFQEHGGQSRVIAVSGLCLLRWILAVIVAAGSLIFLPIQEMAFAQTMTHQMSVGVSPTSMNTSNLPQSQVIFYDKNFVKNLKANTCFVRVCNRRELPPQSGNQHRLYMYQSLNANTTQQAEGVVGSGITVSVVSNTSTIGQYADYVNVSDLALQTAIDPALENIQKELAYRLGLTLSTLVRNTADGASAIDASVNALNLAAAVPFSKTTIVAAVQSLAGKNVAPFQNSRHWGVIHPFIIGDALNDTANNSLTDLLKRNAEGQEMLSELPSPDGDQVPVLDWAGVTFHSTTLVTQTANYLGSGKIALRTYIGGEEALIAISLGKKEQAQVGNGDWRNLNLYIMRPTEPSAADPARVIGGWTSYNVKFVVTLPPDPTQRMRTIDAVSNIS